MPTETTQDFVKWARERLDVTQDEFAKMLGVHRRTVIRYEQDDGPISQKTRLAIVRLLDERKRKRK